MCLLSRRGGQLHPQYVDRCGNHASDLTTGRVWLLDFLFLFCFHRAHEHPSDLSVRRRTTRVSVLPAEGCVSARAVVGQVWG